MVLCPCMGRTDDLPVGEVDHEYAGRKERRDGYRFATSNYHQLHVIAVLDGSLSFRSPHQTTVVRDGDVVVLRPGSAFELSCSGRGYQGVFFITDGPRCRHAAGDAVVVTASAELRVVAGLMDRHVRFPGPYADELVANLGRSLSLLALAEAVLPGASPGSSSEYAAFQVRVAIEGATYSSQSCPEILAAIPLSYRQASRHFARAFGMSPAQYRRACRIREACRLLAGSPLSITEISLELGFSSSQHFSAVFRGETGMTPGQYRRQQTGDSQPRTGSVPRTGRQRR